MFRILTSKKVEIKDLIGELLVVYDFPEEFLDDISDLLLEHKFECYRLST